MVFMRRAGVCVVLAIAALSVGGCGAATPDERSPGGGASTPSPATSTRVSPQRLGSGGDDSLSPSYGPAFPLTLRRTGGIAGFDDRIVLEVNGRVRVETRSVHGRVCTLAVPQQRQLVTLLATLRLGASETDLPTDGSTTVDPGSDPDAVTEPITISVTDDQARRIDLSDPSLGEIAGLVGILVSDVTLSVPAMTRCTTPTTTPPVALAP